MPGSSMSPETATACILQACAQGRPNHDLIEQWILMGGNINAQMTSGKTPLMLAAEQGDAALARFLLRCGASINQQNPYNGQTALMLAAWAGHAEAAVFLYHAGAMVTVKDTRGQTAHSQAKDPARAALVDADLERLQDEAHHRTLERLKHVATTKKNFRL